MDERIFKTKGRALKKPLAVIVADFNQVKNGDFEVLNSKGNRVAVVDQTVITHYYNLVEEG